MKDTIFALATAPGRAGIAVVRISGPAAGRAVETLSRRPLPERRAAVLRSLVDFEGATIDEGLLIWFPKPASFTGEDIAERDAIREAVVTLTENEAAELHRWREAKRALDSRLGGGPVPDH